MCRKKKGTVEIKFVSLQPLFSRKLNINERGTILKAILLAVLMLICITFGSSLNAMQSHSHHLLPKQGQLIAVIPIEEQQKARPIIMVTHYNRQYALERIRLAKKWYSCNIKDIKKLIKQDNPFYYLPSSFTARSLAPTGQFEYYRNVKIEGHLTYLERLMEDIENAKDSPEKIKELVEEAKEHIDQINEALLE